MRKLLVTLDNTLDEWLSVLPNQNKTVRDSLYLYKGDIDTGTVEGMRAAYTLLATAVAKLTQDVKELDSKVDYIASRVG